MENKINQNTAGLNLDSVNYQIKENMITFALNANIQSHDGNSTTYTNEPSNQICYDFSSTYPGFKILNVLSITEQSKLIVFLAHPDGRSLIGEITNLNKDCTSLVESETDCGCISGTVLGSTVVSSLISIPGTGECPTGYTFNSTSGFCEKLISTPIQETVTKESVISSCRDADHGTTLTRVYKDTWVTQTPPTYHTVVESNLTQSFWFPGGNFSYIKQIGIQADVDNTNNPCGTQESLDFLGFTETICISDTKQYYLGLAADDSLRVSIDGNIVFDFDALDPAKSFATLTDLWGRYNLFPVNISKGSHLLKFEYKNKPTGDPGNRGMFAYELYDISLAQLTDPNLTRVILQNSRVLSNGKPITSEIKAPGRILQMSYTGTATGTFTIGSAVQSSTSGTGTDAVFKIVVNAGVITSLILEYSGKGYKTGDTLIISAGSALNVTVTVVAASVQEDFIELSQACPVGYTLYVNENCVASCQKLDQKSEIFPTTSVNCCVFTPLVVDNCCDCTDCYRYSAQATNNQPYSITYINCAGVEVTETFPSGIGTFTAKRNKYTLPVNVEILDSTFVSQGECNPKTSKCCLGLSPDFPVYAEYRIDNCETKVYFIARNIQPRYFSLEEPLGRDQCGDAIDCLTDACERLKLFPDFCQPDIYPTAIDSGGRLKGGVYSFSIAYADENGKELTDYVDFSNPIPIFERAITEQTEYETSKSIRVSIDHSTTIFDYFNLVVAENINEVTTYQLVGTYRVNQSTYRDSLVYSGDYSSTFSSIVPLIRSPHYETAEIIEKQNDILMLADLVETPKYNFQLIANEIKLRWETVKMPVDNKFDFSNPEIAYFFRTYQRDEVYPFGIKFKLKNGKYTDVFHIPGREIFINSNEKDLLTVGTNPDVFAVENDCIVQDSQPRWKVYNTATTDLTPPTNTPSLQEVQYSCKITVEAAGEFAYWESTETYPCYEDVWGALAGQPIRHHKFPENSKVHIHADGDDFIYPIGVRILENDFANRVLDKFTVYDPLNTYGNHQIPVKELICGFELVRGNRVNNKSVVAKGLLYDVGSFEDVKSGKKFYYPNYPYNDLRPDAFIKSTPDWYDRADRGIEDSSSDPASGLRIHEGFNTIGSRYTFHSPDTHFQYPKIGTELKLETVEYGKVQGKFMPVLDHPQYKFLTKADYALSAVISNALALAFDTKTTATDPGTIIQTDGISILTNNQVLLDLIEKLVPNNNFAYQFNSVGEYKKFLPITTIGNRRRFLDIGLYANDKIVELNDDRPLHNRLRETSVYLKTNGSFSTEHGSIIDTSRYTLDQAGLGDTPEKVTESDTRAYYSSIKRSFPNQYGQIENIKYVSMGYACGVYTDLSGTAKIKTKYYPGFGGDTYINKFALKRKHSFFTRNLANLPAKVDNVPFDYWLFPNLGYPTYYIGESPEDINNAFASSILAGAAATLATILTTPALAAGGAATGVTLNAAISGALASIYSLFVKKNNLDVSPTFNLPNPIPGEPDIVTPSSFFYQKGFFYTASYGIPVFYVESDINVDLRHGRNDLEENFYPNVGDGIPDEWLHEVNVPIKFDNFYSYNATYSAQNLSPNLPYRLKYPKLECLSIHTNRVIYSDPANSSNYLSDAWRVFRPGNFYDFPKQGGRLIDLNAGENERVYARFENTTKVYNSRITLSTTSPYQLEIGNAEMFKQKPVDLSKTDLGYIGTQHKAYVKCEYGTFWVDAKRGHIYQITGDGFNEIKTENNFNWFKQNLPFQILKDIPNADVDNPPIGLGIVMGWDERYERVFITKLDYRVKPEYRIGSPSVVKYITDTSDSNYRKYVLESGSTQVEITFGDPAFFENKSWTVAYSPKLKNFISFYSFLPNFYVPLLGNFQTVINTSTGASTWNHNLSIFTYQTYYNKLYPYILEYNVNSFPKVSIINSVTLMQDIQEYYSDYEYYSLSTANKKNLANFTKAIIYNKEQSSGIIKLIPEEFGNTRQKITYPRMTATGIEALISRREQLYTFNGFWNVAAQGNGQPLWSTQWSDLVTQYPIDKVPNTKSVRPVSVSYQKAKIKSDFAKVRLIQDQYSRFKFINTIQITQTNP